jgi:23S rRNA A1618 N6-methylase RlmF
MSKNIRSTIAILVLIGVSDCIFPSIIDYDFKTITVGLSQSDIEHANSKIIKSISKCSGIAIKDKKDCITLTKNIAVLIERFPIASKNNPTGVKQLYKQIESLAITYKKKHHEASFQRRNTH